MNDATYRVELAYAPDDQGDERPWRARVFLDHAQVTTLWGRDRDSALLHARQWIKTQAEHGEPETILLDRNGDVIPESMRVEELPAGPPRIVGNLW